MRRPNLLLIACGVLAALASYAAAQEAAVETPDAPAAEAPAPDPADGPAAPQEEPAADEGSIDADKPVNEPTNEGSAEDDSADDDLADEDLADDEVDVAAPEAKGTDWSGLVSRAPAFLAKTHHAAVHLPIALWLFGALFVLIGSVFPSWRNQVPLACLIGGTLTSIAAVTSGWWYAEYEWGETWTWADGFGDWGEHLVKHRWTGVALVFTSLVLSVLALVNQAKKSKSLGAVWRVGLLLLAAAVAWEGHVGGELIHGEGFLEEAFEAWVHPEE